MKYNIISSSSKGNCIVVEDFLALDVGVSYSKIKKYLNKIKLIFISHIHKDHLLPSTIKQIAYNYPTIKFITGSRGVVEKLFENGVNKKNIYFMKENKWYSLGILDFRLEPLVHDADNYCIKVKFNTIDKKMIYIVDTANVNNIEAKNYDLYLIESNYRKDILQKHIEECEDESKLYYLDRVPKTHLSNEQANGFLIENMGEESIYQFIHCSDYNYEERDE